MTRTYSREKLRERHPGVTFPINNATHGGSLERFFFATEYSIKADPCSHDYIHNGLKIQPGGVL